MPSPPQTVPSTRDQTMPEDGWWDGAREERAEPRRTRMLSVAPASLGGAFILSVHSCAHLFACRKLKWIPSTGTACVLLAVDTSANI